MLIYILIALTQPSPPPPSLPLSGYVSCPVSTTFIPYVFSLVKVFSLIVSSVLYMFCLPPDGPPQHMAEIIAFARSVRLVGHTSECGNYSLRYSLETVGWRWSHTLLFRGLRNRLFNSLLLLRTVFLLICDYWPPIFLTGMLTNLAYFKLLKSLVSLKQ